MTENKIPQEALRLINEISGLNAIIPNMEDDPAIIEDYFDLEDKNISNLEELYTYKKSLELALNSYSANPKVQNYLQELKTSKGIGELNCKISKLEQESILGGKILRETWKKVNQNGFVMNNYKYDSENREDLISIFKENRNMKIIYRGVYDAKLILSSKVFSEQVRDRVELEGWVDNEKQNSWTAIFQIDNVLYEIGTQIMKDEDVTWETDLRHFSKAILNLPDIMNNYMEKIFRR